jgi:hypothetical protein
MNIAYIAGAYMLAAAVVGGYFALLRLRLSRLEAEYLERAGRPSPTSP